MERHLWLIGMMGSGKTATARALATRWGVASIDTDEIVAARAGCSIARLWGDKGEKAFRDMESAAVRDVAAGDPSVIATGGGVVLDEGNVAAMRSTGKVVWLDAPPAVLAARVESEPGRPLLETDSSQARLAEIRSARARRYDAAADVTIDTSGLTVEESADRIETWWNRYS